MSYKSFLFVSTKFGFTILTCILVIITKIMASGAAPVVGAIDFGTTNSGWAYSFLHDFKSEPAKAYVRQWNSGTLVTEKTPTCALISPDGQTLEGFGYDAENKYKDLVEKGRHRGYYYFRRFKMSLNKETIARDYMIKDEMGKKFPAIEVFSMSIAALVEDMIDEVAKTVAWGLSKSDVHWVLTVPAIWSDAAKQFMREAAQMKPASIEKDKLSIALEPEAASIFCRHLSVDHFVGGETISKLPAGTKYMVLDAGGGTIDITIHEVTSSGGLKEVHAASGGGWGATLVDEAFKGLLIDIVGDDVYGKFTKQETEDWIELWRMFETKKKQVDLAKKDKVTMTIPSTLMGLYKKETKQDIRDRIAESDYSGMIHFAGGDKVRFDATLIQSLFKESINKTVTHVNSLLRDDSARDVKAILMVGGFSESPMLQHAIKKAFPNLRITIPKEASSAILRGAVIFGHNPTSITHRVLKKTYGVANMLPFNEDIHDEKYKVQVPKGVFCNKLFSKHIEKGKSVEVGEALAEQRYLPNRHDQKEFRFNIYASDLKDPKYTDQGCHHLGTLEVDISDVPGDLDRRVFIRLIFGDTEVKALARIEKTGQVVSASFDFLG